MRVLVVDDDHAVIEALKELLEDEGYAVSLARNGREALNELRHGVKPCIILLDLMMPVMNGWEFRQEQLRDQELASIPTILVTAYGADEGAGLGDVATIRKPVKPDQLLALIAKHCPRASSGASAPGP